MDVVYTNCQSQIQTILDVAAKVKIVDTYVSRLSTVESKLRSRIAGEEISRLILNIVGIEIIKEAVRIVTVRILIAHTLYHGLISLRRAVQCVSNIEYLVEVVAFMIVEGKIQITIDTCSGRIDKAGLVE